MIFLNKVLVFALSFLVVDTVSQCVKTEDKLIGNTCYTFIKSPLPYWDAQVYCERQNYVYSTLATVSNSIDSTYLASIAATQFETTTGNFWIGLYRRDTSLPFVWQDGTRYTFSNFASGQTSLNCVAESVVNARWTTRDESVVLPFVCGYSVLPFISGSSTSSPINPSTSSSPSFSTPTTTTQFPTSTSYTSDFDSTTPPPTTYYTSPEYPYYIRTTPQV